MRQDTDKKLEALRLAMRRSSSIKPASRFSSLWRGCAFCVTSGGSGFLAGHLGCAVAPFMTTLMPSVAPYIGYDPYDPVLMLKIGFTINAAVLAAWYGLRGRYVSKPIRVATIAIATTALITTTVLKTPHMHDMREVYADQTQGDPLRQAQLFEDARAMGETLDQRLMALCSSSPSPRIRRLATMSSIDKIKASFLPRAWLN